MRLTELCCMSTGKGKFGASFRISRPTTTPDDGKITVTQDAKEVEYEKE